MIPFVTINLDKPRKLRFGMAAMVDFERMTKKKIRSLDPQASMEETMQLLWCMLKQEDPGITLEQTTALVDEYGESISAVIDTVNEAVIVAFETGESNPNAKSPK